MRFATVLEYDGTRFHGSQLQSGVRTVQGDLERALADLFGAPLRCALASRTDSGVHARGQVAAFTVHSALKPDAVAAALNDRLDEDLKIRACRTVAERFDPRRDARRRTYIYTIHNSPHTPVLERRYAAHVRTELDEAALAAGLARLEGEHDFAAFAGSATPADAATVRNVERATVARDGARIAITITANAFLHQQVRRTVGALVALGRGRIVLAELDRLLQSGTRGEWSEMLPPRGLVLQSVEYNGICGADGRPSGSA